MPDLVNQPTPDHVVERALARLDFAGDCWDWPGALTQGGYGYTTWRLDGRPHRRVVHRMVYLYLVKADLTDLSLDHLCRNKICANPDHLEPVTLGVNSMRGFGPARLNSLKMACVHGHPLTPDNVYNPPGRQGQRHCLTCKGIALRERRYRLHAAKAAPC